MKIPTVEQVIKVNQIVSHELFQKSILLDRGKIESALSTAFYPGSEPFENGGVAKIAGALCFYLGKAHAFQDGNKRTATLVAITFMEMNGWELHYPDNDDDRFSELAIVINQAMANEITKDQLIFWFDLHKVSLMNDQSI